MLKAKIGYPSKEEERQIIRLNMEGQFAAIKPVANINDIMKARKTVREVYMDERIEKYIIDIVFASRDPKGHNLGSIADLISYGASPRASINLALASKAYAYMQRRGFVIPEDIRAICADVLRHRIGLTYEAQAENISSEDIVEKILNTVKVP
jgi:MoxR-like ATPase